MMTKPQSEKNFTPKVLQLTYKEFITRNQSLIGLKLGNYVMLDKLGQGAFGSVFKAIDETDRKLVAIKLIDLEIIQHEPNLEIKKIKKRFARTEAEMMLKCNSQNCVKCYDVIENKSLKLMVIEYCNQGSLQDKIEKLKCVPEPDAIEFLKQILNGLSELHRNGIIHRDLKPQNILIHEGVCKIADFGFSKELTSNNYKDQIVHTNCGTTFSMAPQILQAKKYGLQADIWSIGVIFYIMLFGKFPFQKSSRKEILAEIQNKTFFEAKLNQKDVKISQEAKLFILECLDRDSQKRLNWQNIINHNLFNLPFSNFNASKVYLSIFSSNQSNTALDVKKMKDLDATEVQSERQSVTSFSEEDKPPEIIRAIVLSPEQLAKRQDQVQGMVYNSNYPWSKVTNFECLKTQFILQQICDSLEFLPSKISESREIVQILYLIISRCFQDISVRYWQRQSKRNKLIPNFMQLLENSYKKVEIKFEKYLEKLSNNHEQVFELIKSKIFSFFEDFEKQQEKSIYFKCTKKNAENGLPLGPYTRQKQIEFTQKCLNRQIENIIKEGVISKNVIKYLKNYSKIQNLTLKEVGEMYFRTYVTNFFINE